MDHYDAILAWVPADQHWQVLLLSEQARGTYGPSHQVQVTEDSPLLSQLSKTLSCLVVVGR